MKVSNSQPSVATSAGTIKAIKIIGYWLVPKVKIEKLESGDRISIPMTKNGKQVYAVPGGGSMYRDNHLLPLDVMVHEVRPRHRKEHRKEPGSCLCTSL